MLILKCKNQYQENCILLGQMNLIFNIRTVWMLFGLWTRAYLFSVATGLGNLDVVAQKLYGIPVDLYSILRLVFGDAVAQNILNFLSMFVINLQTAMMGLKNGDQASVNTSTVNLYQISADLSNYLNQINPFWSAVQWRNLLDTYISLALREAVALIGGDYTQDIELFDRLVNQAILLGDYMANGLIQYLALRGPLPTQNQQQV